MTSFRRTLAARRAFSLIEVLMAIFILGIGAISIAALFPAGIAQQQQSADDVMGPIVANNAVEILRTKLDQGDFGSFEEFDDNFAGVLAPRVTVEGDWPWARPTHIFTVDEEGAIDVFSRDRIDGLTANRSWEFSNPDGYPNSSPTLYGVPFNRARHGDLPPRITVTQAERSYPQDAARPQYVWDCMFRRFQGRVLVAIFVYRVTTPGGEQAGYRVASEPSNNALPPLPIWRDLAEVNARDAWDPYGADDMTGTADDAFIEGTSCDAYSPFDRSMAWQESGQWLLDQNNNVHRVLSAYCEDDAGTDPRTIELVRPAPAVFDITVPPGVTTGPYFLNAPNSGGLAFGEQNVVTDIWYLPLLDGNGVSLTPVYVTVKEL